MININCKNFNIIIHLFAKISILVYPVTNKYPAPIGGVAGHLHAIEYLLFIAIHS